MVNPMRAIILAAGQGTRLRPLTEHTPKCLLPIGGSNAIVRLINQLVRFGLENIVVLVGYRKDQVIKQIRDSFGTKITIVENDRFRQDAKIFSLWIAVANDPSPFIVFEADTIFEDRCLDLIFAREMEAISVCYTYGYFRKGQTGAILKADRKSRVVDIRLIKDYEDQYRDYKILLGLHKVGEEETSVFLKLLSEACAESIDQPYMAPWAKHLSQLPCCEMDLASTKVCTFNTADDYYAALKTFGE